MRFISILWQWFSTKKANPSDYETKKAVLQLLWIDNLVVMILCFWAGIRFTLLYPEIAEQIIETIESLLNVFGGSI
jgi:preprotein translocase subunit SecY